MAQLPASAPPHPLPVVSAEPACKLRPANPCCGYLLLPQVPKGVVALSNGPEASATDSGSVTIVVFEPTPLMSPYLLAITAGNLKQYTPSGGTGRRLQADSAEAGNPTLAFWAVPGLADQLELAAEVAPKALAFYTSYLKYPLPLTKYDLVAVPGKQGAMEVGAGPVSALPKWLLRSGLRRV
jgi:aminopeptidase N